ncbi:fimbrial protein [Providencia rettgeri]|nr:fimbrial protein [Providencia rettgeri]NIL70122.1 fimbrial protein [Providencia sp. 504mA]HCI97347.1 MrfF protein [Providencia sp.]EJD6402082.1 fimbrial protein [Providencia rettgeri]EJD6583131.1 fimbrial protein [Providencia rettgeri]
MLLLYSSIGLAEVFSVNIKIDVIQKSCDVYGDLGPNLPIEINFGEMNLNGFTSERYARNINYNLDCGDKSSSNPSLKLIFESSSSDFDTTLVGTSNPNLGLKILADNTLLLPNQPRNFMYSKKPSLSVIPVLNDGEEIKLGPFDSSGIIKVEYQ